jgi:hypothetical protein
MGSRLDVSGLAPPGRCPARSRHRPRPAPDRVPPVRPQERLGRRPARRGRGERVPRVPLLGRVRRMAPRPHRGGGGGDQGPRRPRVRRFPPRPPLRADRLRLPRWPGGAKRTWSWRRTTCCSCSTARAPSRLEPGRGDGPRGGRRRGRPDQQSTCTVTKLSACLGAAAISKTHTLIDSLSPATRTATAARAFADVGPPAAEAASR